MYNMVRNSDCATLTQRERRIITRCASLEYRHHHDPKITTRQEFADACWIVVESSKVIAVVTHLEDYNTAYIHYVPKGRLLNVVRMLEAVARQRIMYPKQETRCNLYGLDVTIGTRVFAKEQVNGLLATQPINDETRLRPCESFPIYSGKVNVLIREKYADAVEYEHAVVVTALICPREEESSVYPSRRVAPIGEAESSERDPDAHGDSKGQGRRTRGPLLAARRRLERRRAR